MYICYSKRTHLLLRGDAEHSEAEVCLPAQEETHPHPLSRGELPETGTGLPQAKTPNHEKWKQSETCLSGRQTVTCLPAGRFVTIPQTNSTDNQQPECLPTGRQGYETKNYTNTIKNYQQIIQSII